MSILSNTLKASQSPGGLKCLLNDNALIFCCIKQQNDENSNPSQKPKETSEIKNLNESANVENSNEEIPLTDFEETAIGNNEKLKEDEKDVNNEKTLQPLLIEPNNENEENEENEENDIYIEDLDNFSDCEVNVVNVIGPEIPDRTKTGELQVRVGIYSEKPCLNVTIVDAYDLVHPCISEEQPLTEAQPVVTYSVHTLVLPLRKLRFKSKLRKGPNPYFDEVIKIPKINPENIKSWILRFRLYGSMKGSAKQILGEGYLFLYLLELEMKSQCKISLLNYESSMPENVVDTMISASICNYESMMSLDSLDGLVNANEGEESPEILIGLSFNSNIGRLTLEIIKGNNFPKSKKNKHPDTFITILLLTGKDNGKVSAKTNVKKGTCEPIFEENFVFQIQNDQLGDVSFAISGFFKRRIGKGPTFGTFNMGSLNSTEEEMLHWKDLTSSMCGNQILRSHKFQSPEKI